MIEIKLPNDVLHIAPTDDNIAKLRAMAGGRRKMPGNRQSYWYVSDDGIADTSVWDGDQFDLFRLNANNCFLTEADCDREIALLAAIARIKTAIDDAGMYWEPDWTNDAPEKYYIGFKRFHREILVSFEFTFDCSPLGIYFRTESNARHILDTCRDDFMIAFGMEG